MPATLSTERNSASERQPHAPERAGAASGQRNGVGRLLDALRRLFGALGRTDSHRQRSEIAFLAKTVSLNPENDRALLRLADAYVRAGDSERALSAYWHAVEIYAARHDAQKSAAILKRIVSIDQGDVGARLRLAAALDKMSRRREAAHQYQQAGSFYKGQNQVDEAVRCFAKSLELDPFQKHSAQELERLRPPAPKVAAPPQRATGSNKPLPKLMPLSARIPPPSSKKTPLPFVPPAILGDPLTETAPTAAATFQRAATAPAPERAGARAVKSFRGERTLQAASVAEEPAATIAEPDAVLVLELDFDDPTREYRPEDLSTLLATDDDEFGADTVCNDALPEFDELHRPTDSVEPMIIG